MNARRDTFGALRIRRPSFTLVEMLVVVTIIAILAGIVFGGMAAVRVSAQTNRTQAIIAKLHLLVMSKYDSYRTRRVPVDLDSHPALSTARQMARVKLWAIRELMRMEMPERYVDLNSGSGAQPARFKWPTGGDEFTAPESALFVTYIEYRDTLTKQGRKPTPRYGSAEMLYMLITVGCPNGRQSFSEDEIGDLDGDGWPEFVDAWGNPIFFLRWAPGFTDSAIQLTPGGRAAGGGLVTIAYAAKNHHDPFDPMMVEPNAYQLIPLIYSAGPDGIYDIQMDDDQYTYFKDSQHSPYGTGNVKIGTPADSDNFSRTGNTPANGRLDHFDNIHNHRMGTR